MGCIASSRLDFSRADASENPNFRDSIEKREFEHELSNADRASAKQLLATDKHAVLTWTKLCYDVTIGDTIMKKGTEKRLLHDTWYVQTHECT